MSNSSWPPPPGQSPWAQQDPRWTPQSYQDVQGRDPRQPFGQPATPQGPPPSVEDFQEPSRNRGPFIMVVVVIAAVLVVVGALQLAGPADDPKTSASPTQPTVYPTVADTSGNSVPYEGHGTGTLELVSSEWGTDGVTVRFRVTPDDTDERSFTVYAFNNSSLELAEPDDPSAFNVAGPGPYEGSAFFEIPQGDTTFVLASSGGRPLAGLLVSG
ncbi:MAG: hypothetical protein ACK5KO_10535 [Arachnia sp.]